MNPIIPALGRLRKEDCLKLEVSPDYVVGPRPSWATVRTFLNNSNNRNLTTAYLFPKISVQ